MRIVLRQTFPLGRFHATPWRANPFDDPFGEWPPSPWRLIRGVVARWHQWMRENPQQASQWRDPLIKALCTSSFAFHLPVPSWRGTPVRQYHPVEFGWNPPNKKKAGVRSYGTSLAQDNYICLPPDPDAAVLWFLDGHHWTSDLVHALDECLKRMTYFGRAESFTRISVGDDSLDGLEPNCTLHEVHTPGSVPVLAPEPNATCEDIERVTDDPATAKRSVPPGARRLYASPPPNPVLRTTVAPQMSCPESRLIQFAIGWNVPPEMRSTVRLTAKFRGAVLRELVRMITGDPEATWSKAPLDVRQRVAGMAGKDAYGNRLEGHCHAEYLVWCEDGRIARLLVWRDGRPFDQLEQQAILKAAHRQFAWSAAGNSADVWKVRLVPLDQAVPPPPGFGPPTADLWESVTPYVPPRHHLRGGKPRLRESIDSQIRRELSLRHFINAQSVIVAQVADPEWVAVHIPYHQRSESAFLGDRRGYYLRLQFPHPVPGPIRLGHSSGFGLGLFRPVS